MPTVLLQDTQSIRTLSLNRPERRNALTPELQEELIAAFRNINPVTTRAVILRAEGESFCAGLDIAELQKSADKSAEEHAIDAERIARTFRAIYDCDIPTIAAVQGAAIAGGTGLAALCDFTLATPDAKFGFTEARIGFVPALVSAYLMLQMPEKQARGLLLTGRIFGAEEALRLGLVNEIVPAGQLDARAAELAAELLRNSPESLRATKRLLRAQQRSALDAALALGIQANAASRQTDDFREGVAAFLEKRKPDWNNSLD